MHDPSVVGRLLYLPNLVVVDAGRLHIVDIHPMLLGCGKPMRYICVVSKTYLVRGLLRKANRADLGLERTLSYSYAFLLLNSMYEPSV